MLIYFWNFTSLYYTKKIKIKYYYKLINKNKIIIMSHSVSLSQPEPAGNGNSDSFPAVVNQLYKYDFVINNYTEPELLLLNSSLNLICKKAVYGLEIGESGTPHVQGYISLKVKKRITELHKIPGLARASFRNVRNENALIDYCQKENCKFKIGFPVELNIIKDLKIWQKEIIDMCLVEPDSRTINWLYDSRTSIGKTALTKYMVTKHGAVFFTGGKKADIACQMALEKQNGRDLNNKMIIIFNYSCEDSNINYAAFEGLKDGLISSSKYKSSGLIFNHPHIWILANTMPDVEHTTKRLNVWKVWQVVNDKLSLIN